MSSQSPQPKVPNQSSSKGPAGGKNAAPASADQQSIGQLVTSAVGEVSHIVTAQVELAKAELRQSAKRGASAAILGVVAAVLGFLALVFLLLTLAYVLVQLGLPTWAGFGIVTLLLIIIVLVLAMVASKKIKGIKGPEKTIAEIETTKTELIAAAKPPAKADAKQPAAAAKPSAKVAPPAGSATDKTAPPKSAF